MSLFPPPVSNQKKQNVILECVNCHAQNKIEKLFNERPSDLEPGLIEGVSTCPECGHVTHAYWASPGLIQQRVQIFGMIAVLSRRRTPMNFERIKQLKEKYKNLFDIEQAKYREMLEQRDGRPA